MKGEGMPQNTLIALERLWREYKANDREIAKLERRGKALRARIRVIETARRKRRKQEAR